VVSRNLIPLFLLAFTFASGQTPATPVSLTAPSASQSALAPISFEERGDLFMVRKMYRDAIAAYKQGPQNSPVIWDKIGIAWHNLNELDLARKSYEHALKVDKTYAEAINNIGTVYYAQKRYGTAIKRYRKAIQMEPAKASFWSNLGMAYYSQGKINQMREAFDKAMSLDPDIFEHRGTVGTEMQDRTVTDRAQFHFELARAYAKIGKDDLAMEYLRHSFEEGFKDKDKVRKSPEFSGLLENPKFIELMALEPRVL
jgi:tetratricopeptide (TPR) repeat protein